MEERIKLATKMIGEEERTYEFLDKFQKINMFNREKYELQDFSELVYVIYPTFFLRGVIFNGKKYIMDEYGNVMVGKSLANHYPQSYMYFRLSMFVRAIMKENGWPIVPEEIAQITERCERDFFGEYLDFFPFVVRVFTSSNGKKEDYVNILPQARFTTFDFEEIQADVDGVSREKLNDVDFQEEDDMCLVDDVGLEFHALRGAPGPYIKYFMGILSPEEIDALCDRCGSHGVTVHVCVAVSYKRDGVEHRILQHAYFPCVWKWDKQRKGYGFDAYVEYLGERLDRVDYQSRFRAIILGWVWHRFKRRMCGVI